MSSNLGKGGTDSSVQEEGSKNKLELNNNVANHLFLDLTICMTFLANDCNGIKCHCSTEDFDNTILLQFNCFRKQNNF